MPNAHRIMLFLFLSGCSSSGTKTPDDMLSASDKCVMDCMQGQDVGAPLAQAFLGCVNDACQSATEEEQQACISKAIDPGDPNAACHSMRDACFAGKIQGCKELADHVEQVCTPTTIPISMDQFGAVAFCLITEGWKGATSAQAKAWPLYSCVFSADPAGCQDECANGGAACRACAQQKCGTLYSACMADSSTVVNTDVPADKASCQAVTGCVLSCP